MFIPINARADIAGSKKGKLTPAQNAQLNAWCLASKTGILDFPQDHSKPGRCEAENAIYTATNYVATVVFNKGYIVICGRLVECEKGSEVQIRTPVVGTTKGKIILRYSLSALKEEEFVVTTTTSDLRQEDLNDDPLTGVYEFELYSYEATPTTVTLTRNQTYVPDIGGKLSQFEASLKDEGKPLHGYDDTKGTIEERLTRLGFKEGSVALSSGTATVNRITRQGNYCILSLDFSNLTGRINQTLFTIPENFRPLQDVDIVVSGEALDNTIPTRANAKISLSIKTSGKVLITNIQVYSGFNVSWATKIYKIQIGYEAQPIQQIKGE